MKLKTMFSKKNILNGLFIVLLLVIVFVPAAKSVMLQGLMQVGFLKPNVTQPQTTISSDLSGIKFKDIKGREINLAELKGKVVFINFWATWCPPCLAEMPSINTLHQKFSTDQDVVFIMVDADGDFQKSQNYMDKRRYKMPVYTMASSIPESLFKGSLPTTIVFDKKGRISFHEQGAANYSSQKFVDFITQLKNLKD
jgi:thiol-disulfide isomerase/thioredoxin